MQDRPRETVVHLISGTGVGGAERALYNLLKGGLADRFQSYVVSLTTRGPIGDQIAKLGVPVVALGFSTSLRSLPQLWTLRRLLRRLRPDLIQGWMYHGNLASTVIAKSLPDSPAVLWNVRHCLYDLYDERRSMRQLIRASRLVSRSPNGLLYNSELSRTQHELFGFSGRRAQVIPNGIDTERFAPKAEVRQRLRDQLSLSPTDRLIGHVGRYHPVKDHHSFVRAAVRLARSDESVHFVMIGLNVDWDTPDFREWIPEGLRPQFHLLGLQSGVEEWMNAMDVFCQSSFTEAFPNVLGEAMSSGLVCVATDVGDSALILGSHGHLVPARDPDALFKAFDRLPAGTLTNPAGRSHIRAHFTLERIVDRYTACYRSAIAARRR